VGALDGIRVIDIGQWIAGPLAAMLLADQGAEVIHIDPPGGPRWQSAANATLNRGKECRSLDLKTEEGRATARRLIGLADAVIENFRPGVMSRLGLESGNLLSDHPRLIWCSIPGFASDDPRAGTPGWEGVVAAATGTYRPANGAGGEQSGFTALPIASSFGAIAAAVAIVMALIARERDGLGQRIEVPLFDAMFLAIGAAGLRVNGAPAGGRPDDPWNGQFLCADGRAVRLSLATPRFVRRFVEAAGMEEWIARGYLEEGALASGTEARAQQQREFRGLFQSRSSDEWEDLGRQAGVPLTKIRTSAEWIETPHARAASIVTAVTDPEFGTMLQPGLAVRLNGTPGAIRGRTQDGPNRIYGRVTPLPGNAGLSPAVSSALEGIRVVDLTQVLAGPTAARTLAEYGADVIKVNNPWEKGAGYRWNVHRYHTDVNRGKRTILLDLKTPGGQDVLWSLVDRADVLVQNFRPQAAERLGIAYEQVRRRRPDIVYGTVSMYGSGGPWSELPGYEVNAQAVSGMVARAGGAGQPFAVNDYSTGLLGALGMGLALFHRTRTGKGQSIEAALARTATVLQTVYLQSIKGGNGEIPAEPAHAANGWSALQRLYRAADAWFFLGAAESQQSLLASVDGLAGVQLLSEVAREEALEQRFAARTAADWVSLLRAAGIGAQAVTSIELVMSDPWAAAHGLAITRRHREGSAITTVGPPARLSRTPVQAGRPVSPPGGDAAEVLATIDMEDKLDYLVSARAVVLD